MDIDWSKAPEGATHFDTKFNWFCREGGFWNSDLEWVPVNLHVDWGTDRYIPRPAKPAAPEWDGEGLPPVGCICECLFNDGWSKVAVLAHYGDESWVKRPRKTHIVSKGLGNEFRPIRTKERRELESIIHDCDYNPIDSAIAIIAAGYRKEKQDD